MATSAPPAKRQKLDEPPTTTSQIGDLSGSLHSNITSAEGQISAPSRNQYTLGWIAALPLELAAAIAMLDHQYEKPLDFTQSSSDKNSYAWGCIGEHNMVIASLPAGVYGTISAATTASQMLSSFPQIRSGLMVGIGAAIPRPEEGLDIRLGDIVVSQPDGRSGGVIQYDLGKAKPGRFERKGILNMPPEALLKALAKLQALHKMFPSKVPEYLQEMVTKYPQMAKSKPRDPSYVHQGKENDRLFTSSCIHVGGFGCNKCDPTEIVQRDDRESNKPEIHYGVIASGDKVVKDATIRDSIIEDAGEECVCLEMEAAGLMNSFPCLVIRGICDYADSHKNDRWQPYAAATAAAYAKEFLSVLPREEVARSETAAKIVGHLENIEAKVDDTNINVRNLHSAFTSSKLNVWLAPPDPSTNFNEALDKRYEGTGLWFLERDEFKEWKSRVRQHLWLRGIPGAGKTVLSASIIDTLRKSNTTSVILYFFLDFSDKNKRTLHALLRGLIVQLYAAFPQSRKHLDTLYGTCQSGNQQPSVKDLEEAFKSMLSTANAETQIVIDALDECSTREELLSWIKSLSNSGLKYSLLVTSRDEKDIESSLIHWLSGERDVVSIKSGADADIQAYVQGVLYGSTDFQRWKERQDVLRKMETKIMEKAKGMFRLAACQLKLLTQCVLPRDVDRTLKQLPQTLFDVYRRILEGINDLHRETVIRLLQFLVYSERPLRIHEAVDAVAVDLDRKPEFEFSLRMPDRKDIMNLCPSFFSLVTKENKNSNKKTVTEIHLAHLSVKEYLMSPQISEGFREISNQITARACITRVCLAYLSQFGKALSSKDIISEFPLAIYCSRYWMDHAKFSGEQQNVQHATLQFFQDDPAYKIWVSLYDPDGLRVGGLGKYNMPAPLYYASQGGLSNIVGCLLEKEGIDVNAQGGNYGNALQAASYKGHEQIVRLLVDKGANVNAQGGNYGNALYAASDKGHEQIVRLLVDKGANVNAQGGFYRNALQAASDKGHEQIVRLLVDKGADVNAQGRLYGNALQAASYNGHEQIVRLLVDKGADVNAQGGMYDNALYAASDNGHEQIVRLLVDKGADVNAQGRRYNNALYAASYNGHEQIVRLLVDKGADVNAQGGWYGNALYAALYKGHEQIVRLLVDKGANVNAHGNALYAASDNGHEQVVRLLVDKGVRYSVQDNTSNTR